MAYVVRDKNGSVISVLANPAEQKSGHLDLNDDEVDELFGKDDAARQLQEVLVASDLSFVRVMEDRCDPPAGTSIASRKKRFVCTMAGKCPIV